MIKLKSLVKRLDNPPIQIGINKFITMNSMELYKNLNQPMFAPPSFLFPIVWTILFILMGISSYMIYESSSPLRDKALTVYGLQLFVNFIWPLLFFNAKMYLFAFVWLVLLWILVLCMIILFYKIKPVAAYLQIPYLLWLTFAAYLNFSVYLLN